MKQILENALHRRVIRPYLNTIHTIEEEKIYMEKIIDRRYLKHHMLKYQIEHFNFNQEGNCKDNPYKDLKIYLKKRKRGKVKKKM